MTDSQLSVSAVSYPIQLRVDGLVGGTSVTLTDDSGALTIKMPAKLCPCKPGEVAFVNLGITRVAVEPAPPSSPLILPGAMN